MHTHYQIKLYFTHSGSNKEYHAHMRVVDKDKDLWEVYAKYGSRGYACNEAWKTSRDGEPFEKAQKAFEKLVRDKVRKGYTENESGRFASKGEQDSAIDRVRLLFRHRDIIRSADPEIRAL
jgi:predicted DNA-binding WGR domain protein